MPTRNVMLTDRQAELVEALVQSGRFENASAVLHEGLRLIEASSAESATRLDALRAAILLGIDDLESGRHTTLDDANGLERHIGRIAGRAIGRTPSE